MPWLPAYVCVHFLLIQCWGSIWNGCNVCSTNILRQIDEEINAPSCIRSLRPMWHGKLVADGLALRICSVQTEGFVLLSHGEDQGFLLASRFLSVGATKKNICGMQGRGGEKGRKEGMKRNWRKDWQTPLALNVPSHCLLCIVYSGGNTSIHHTRHIWAQLSWIQLCSASGAGGEDGLLFAGLVRDTDLIHSRHFQHICPFWIYSI